MCLNKCSDTNVVFQTAIFYCGRKKQKGPQALTAIPATAFPEVVYVTVTLSYVFASNYSLNRLNCFFVDFLMVRG